MPFSDPLADGPVIQRATERALAAGATPADDARRSSAAFAPTVAAPIVLFSYANPIVRMGLEAFARRARRGRRRRRAGARPADRGGRRVPRRRWRAAGLDTIFLLSPTTTDARIRQAARARAAGSSTASRGSASPARATRCRVGRRASWSARIRAHTDLPVALGLRHLDARSTSPRSARYADAAVVGSALVALIAEARVGSTSLVDDVDAYVRWLEARVRDGAGMRHGHMTLDDLRKDIDRVDEVLVRLLERAGALRLRDRPAEEGAGHRDLPARPREGRAAPRAGDRVARARSGPDAIARLFERIIDEARRLERARRARRADDGGRDATQAAGSE